MQIMLFHRNDCVTPNIQYSSVISDMAEGCSRFHEGGCSHTLGCEKGGKKRRLPNRTSGCRPYPRTLQAFAEKARDTSRCNSERAICPNSVPQQNGCRLRNCSLHQASVASHRPDTPDTSASVFRTFCPTVRGPTGICIPHG